MAQYFYLFKEVVFDKVLKPCFFWINLHIKMYKNINSLVRFLGNSISLNLISRLSDKLAQKSKNIYDLHNASIFFVLTSVFVRKHLE